VLFVPSERLLNDGQQRGDALAHPEFGGEHGARYLRGFPTGRWMGSPFLRSGNQCKF